MIILLCGLSGVGKTTLANTIKQQLADAEIFIEVIDADEYRQRLFKDLGYTKEDRNENIRRLGFIANKFSVQNIITVRSAINPYDALRKELVSSYNKVKVVHIDCPVTELVRRDTKGLYKRALLPDTNPLKLTNLTGVNDPFEAPVDPDLYINTKDLSLEQSAESLFSFVLNNRYTFRKTVNQ